MRYFLCFLFLGFSFTSISQTGINDESYYSHRLSTDNGLSQSNANIIIKDSDGFLWIGTDEGLNRYDGYDFLTFYSNPNDSSSLQDDKIWVLHEGSNEKIWIGTNIGGLNVYDKFSRTFQAYTHDPDIATTISNNSITTIYEDSQDRLWIGTLWGLNLFDQETRKFQRFYQTGNNKGLTNNEIQGISEKDGFLWIATRGGLTKINLKSLSPSVVIENPTEYEANINSKMECLFIDSNNDIWVGTNGAGLVKYDEKTNSLRQYSLKEKTQSNTSDIILSIIEDSEGELLIGTDGSGLFRFYTSDGTFKRIRSKNDPTFANSSFYGVYKDHDDLLWLGSYANGLIQINRKDRGFYHFEYFNETMKSYGKNSVLCLAEDFDNNIWIGTDGAGLYKYNPTTRQFTTYIHNPSDRNSISGNVVKSLLVDQQNNIYAGTYAAGLNYINTSTNRIKRFTSIEHDTTTLPSDHVWDLYEDSDHRIWVGLLGGFGELLPEENRFVRYPINIFDSTSLGSSDITKIYEDKNGNLWVGTLEGGLGKLDKDTKAFKRYEYDEYKLIGISNNEVKDIFEDKDGKLWVGTNGGGLNYYDENLDDFIWNKSSSSLSDEILSVQEDAEGNFWIGTFNGLAKYNPEVDVVKYYTKGFGIQGNEFNYDASIKSEDGTFYFGGLNGLTFFNPENIQPDLNIPSLILADFYLFHEKMSIEEQRKLLPGDINFIEKLTLEPNQNILTFKYAALDFSLPRKNNYAYKLEGFDKDWNYVQNQRTATYTNLPSGKYTFHVIASNSEGYWNEHGKQLRVEIKPYWYQKSWAYILFFAAGILIIYGLIRIRTGLLLRQKRLLEIKVKFRTKQIEQQKKELIEHNERIKDQNEALKNKNEEIQTQREQLEEKSVLLEHAHAEIKKANEELKKSNTELEKVVDQRTAELRDTISKLIKTDEELNTFLYRSSHDLRGPIVTLIGLTQLAKMEVKDDQYLYYFDKISKSCFHMLQFLKKLNDSNVLFKSIKVNDKINWPKIIREVKLELEKVDPDNKVKKLLDLNIDKILYADEVMIKTIIQNLMENSIVFCRRFDPFVKLTLAFENNHLIIRVLDNGIGIDPKIHDKIFNMFFRGSGLSQGNGLGLYLVQRALEIVEGEIEFNSKTRDTTEFTVKIPIERSESRPADTKEEMLLNLFEEKF